MITNIPYRVYTFEMIHTFPRQEECRRVAVRDMFPVAGVRLHSEPHPNSSSFAQSIASQLDNSGFDLRATATFTMKQTGEIDCVIPLYPL